MTADFVPFLPTARAQAAPAASSAPAFSPVVSTSTHAKTSAAPASEHDFKVELKRDGERISQILIQCHCGERIQIDCEY